jgi:hypothetical protein
MIDHRPLNDDAQNVTVVQAAAGNWDVMVTGTDTVVGRIVKDGEVYFARDAADRPLGEYTSRELAVFGVVNPD